ncbi:MAG: carbohydrate kinase family protein, partial [Chloroflexota bacterium]|nr:carbohydrate kinase family protein [Chloroflexota bacterium]
FLVDSMKKQRGGVATNIAYNLALLGERPKIMATVGQDFAEYRAWLDENGVDTSAIVEIKDEFTASFFVSTDGSQNQIAMFYTGAMAHAYKLSFKEHARGGGIDLVVISPNDPRAMVQYVRECKALRLPYIYDPSQQIIRLSGEELADGVRGSTMAVMNDYEFEMLKNKTGWKDGQVAAETNVLIVTRGEQGSTIYAEGKPIDIPASRARRNLDPTGVGDAYRAGIIKGYLKKLPWETTGRLGSLAATYALEEHGTQNHRYNLSEFCQRYGEEFGETPEL